MKKFDAEFRRVYIHYMLGRYDNINDLHAYSCLSREDYKKYKKWVAHIRELKLKRR